MKSILIIFFLLATSPASWAGDEKKPLQRTDFGYGMELTVSGKSAIYGLVLPAQIYEGCTRADLGDLRVFNSRNIIPHLLRPQLRKQDHPAAVALPFFPLPATVGSNAFPPDLHIGTNSRGTIIDIRLGRTEKAATSVTSYIIDTSGLEQEADWLEFSWSGQSDHFSTSVRLESSTDLNSWHTLIRSASLAELSFGGHNLMRKRIVVQQGIQKKTYLRLSWPAGKKGVALTAIKAGYNKEDSTRARTVTPLTGKSVADSEQGMIRFHYTLAGFFPVDQLYVRLPQHNSLAQVTVFSRPDKDAPWRRRASLLSYQLTVDGVTLESMVKDINPVTDRFWRLEMEKIGSAVEPPTLELGWLPGQLVFLAQGEEPYTLVYGRSGLTTARYQVDQLLKSIDPLQEKDLVMTAQAGTQIILGGKDMLKPVTEIPWRRWLLWLALIAGVLVIGGMALQLFKEMNRHGS